MTRYENLKDQPKKFLSLTGYTVEEFSALLPCFSQRFFAYVKTHTLEGKPKKRKYTTYPNSCLLTVENKRVLPWAISAASAVLIFLLIGVGTQYFSPFQKPYNLNATSEPTIEIIEAHAALDSLAKPSTRNQAGNSVIPGKSLGVGQKSDAPLFAAVAADEAEITTPEPQWIQTRGPEGGRVVDLFATTLGDIYAGTAAGLYRFMAGQRAWKLVTNNAPEAFTVYNEIGWWPMTAHRDTLYFTTDTKVLASMDRGETWNVLGTHPKGLPIGIVITDRDLGEDIVIYLALANGIFRSEDAGKSWVPLKDGLEHRKIRVLAAVENTVFVGNDDGLYRFNAGTWEQLSVTQTDMRGQKLPIQALAVAGHRLYAAAGKQFTSHVATQVNATMAGDTWWSLYRSTDLGDTWHVVDPRKRLENEKVLKVLKDGSVIEFSRVVTNLENAYSASKTYLKPYVKIFASAGKVMVTDRQHHYYSLDTGETWTSLDLHDTLYDRRNVIPAVMLDARTFYIGGAAGVHRTTDAGQSWHQFNTGLVSTDVTDLVAANGKLYAKITDGIVTSTDGGETWTLIPIGIDNITALAAFDGTVYVRGEKNRISRLFRLPTDDDSLTAIPGVPAFEKITSDEQAWLNKRQEPFQDALTAEAKQNFKVNEPLELEDYEPNKLDAALTKRFHDLGAIIAILRSGDFVVSGANCYVERGEKLFRWKPGTTTWHDTGLISEGKLTRTDPSGENPDAHGFQAPSGLKLAASGRSVYVGTGNGHLLQSFDEGDTWKDVTSDLPFSVVRFKTMAFAGSTIYVATDKGVIYSSNSTHWQKPKDVDGTPLVINKFAMDGTTVYGITDVHVHPERHVYQLKKNSNMWKQITPEIMNRVTSLAVDGNILYVGTIGSGVIRFTLDE